jgi:hypothetical protein
MVKAKPQHSTTLHDWPQGWMTQAETEERIKKIEGDAWRLVGAAMLDALKSGQLQALDRFVNSDGIIENRLLTRDDWKDAMVMSGGGGSLWFASFFPLHGHNLFFRRIDVQRLWGDPAAPATTEATGAAAPLKSQPATKPGRRVMLAAKAVERLERDDVIWADVVDLLEKVKPLMPKRACGKRTLEEALLYRRSPETYLPPKLRRKAKEQSAAR